MAKNPIDFSSIGGKQVQAAPIDFSSIGGKPVQASAPPISASQAVAAGTIPTQPAAVPTSWRQPKDPFSGQPYGNPVPPEVAADMEARDRLQGRAGQIQNISTTPVSNAVAAESGAEGILKASELGPGLKSLKAIHAFQGLTEDIGSHPVQMTDQLANSLANLKQGADTGLNMPPVVNKLVTRLADVDEGPLTYSEARQFYSNMGDLAASDRMAMNAKAQRLLLAVQHSLGDTIADTTERASKLSVYRGAMADFASAKSAEEKLDVLKNWATKAGLGAVASAGAGALAAGGYKLYQDFTGK